MKKFASIFLLTIFLLNIAGYFGLFSYLKQENYESIFKKDNHEINLVRLVIQKTERILWSSKNEFVYQGKHFDVFSKSSDEKNYYFVCISDSKEDSLIDAFNNQVSNQLADKANSKNSHHQNNKVLLQDFILRNSAWLIQISFTVKSSNQISFSLLTKIGSVFSPPPEA